MNKTLFLFLQILCISLSLKVSDANQELLENKNLALNSYYVITTAKVWTSSEESVCLVLLKEVSLANAVIDLRITSINGKQIYAQKYWPLKSYSQCIRLPIDAIRTEKALLSVRLAEIIDETLEIRIKPSNGLTLIETSKPIYRTNERLEFRIITINDWLRPIEESFQSIAVENSKSMVVMEWTDVSTKNGIIGLEMPIAEDNYYGTWKIKAINNRNSVTEKIFKVHDYETPNIIISINSPNYINRNDKESKQRICVNDNYGQPMKGMVKMFAGYVEFDWERIQMIQHISSPVDLQEFQIDGCYDLFLHSSKLNWNSAQTSQRNLKISLQFIDANNGFVEEKFLEIPVIAQDMVIGFPSVRLMKQYFKPGLPYFGHVMAVRPDYSPAPNQQLTVCYQSRAIPWVSQTDYVCKQMMTNSDGLLEFIIPPMDSKLKQIEIKVFSTLKPSIENKMVLEPSYSPSNEYMTVRPIVNTNHCNESIEFEVFFNIDMNHKKVYYQMIGQGIFHTPQVHHIRNLNHWSEQNMIGKSDPTIPIFTTKMRINLPMMSALNNNLVNRLLVYFIDSSDNLVADSNAFLTTCADNSTHSTRIKFERDILTNDQMKIVVNARQNTTCALRVSKNRPYNSLKRINQFIEKFTVRQESGAKDKCEKNYILRKSAAQSPYSAPYDYESSISQSYDPVINYGDAWDSFNDIGLAVSSNAKMDESPCDWDLYTEEALSQLSLIKINEIKNLNNFRVKKIASNEMMEIEKSLFNEVFDWHFCNTQNSSISERNIDLDTKTNHGDMYADAVCLNRDTGITYVRTKIDRLDNQKPFKLMVTAPEEARVGDTVVYKVIVQKTATIDCLPIQISFDNSSDFETMSQPIVQCVCDSSGQPMQMMMRPKSIGPLSVAIVAQSPMALAPSVSHNCVQTTQSVKYSPQIFTRQLSVSPMGIVSENINHKVICNKKNSDKVELDTSEMRGDSGDGSDGSDGSDMLVTNDIIDPMLSFIKSKVSSRNHNALDALSAFAASYYLYKYSSNMSIHGIDRLNKDQLTRELSKSFQSLMTYRHSDGSYSLFKSKKHKSDLGLTVSVFRVMAQSKPYLSFIEKGHRINRLGKTLIWILGQQSNDGCFHIGHERPKADIWPISFEDNYQLTGFVLASLLEAGLDLNTRVVAKAYDCLANNSMAFKRNIESKPLSAILFTYIQLLNGNPLESQQWMESVKVLNNLDESDLLSREVLSYLALSYYLSKDFGNAKSIGERLAKTANVWQTPISCYAITKLWPLLKYKTSDSVKVYKTNNGIVSRLVLNESHSTHKLDGHIVSIDNDKNEGCIFVANNQVKSYSSSEPTERTETTNFDIRIDAMDKGFVTCNRRRLRVCVRPLNGTSSEHPVVRMQIITGFQLDSKVMKKMIDTEVVSKYKRRGSEVMLFLHAFDHQSDRFQCFTVPVVRRQEFYDKNKAFIKIYDYYNEDVSDVIAYEIPLECQIDSRFVAKKND